MCLIIPYLRTFVFSFYKKFLFSFSVVHFLWCKENEPKETADRRHFTWLRPAGVLPWTPKLHVLCLPSLKDSCHFKQILCIGGLAAAFFYFEVKLYLVLFVMFLKVEVSQLLALWPLQVAELEIVGGDQG